MIMFVKRIDHNGNKIFARVDFGNENHARTLDSYGEWSFILWAMNFSDVDGEDNFLNFEWYYFPEKPNTMQQRFDLHNYINMQGSSQYLKCLTVCFEVTSK
jgi:hypothetical protein